MSYQLKIDGVALPTPTKSGIQIVAEKIWSSNTGRSGTGKMMGTIVAVKRTVAINWGRLTAEQAGSIRDATSSTTSFHELSFTDIDGKVVTMEVYFSSPQFTIQRLVNKQIPVITGATVQAIER
jgi:hypothetical protein